MEPAVKSAAITIQKWSAGGSQGGFSEEGTHVSHLLNLAEAFARETNRGKTLRRRPIQQQRWEAAGEAKAFLDAGW